MPNNQRFKKAQASLDNIKRSAFKSLSHSIKTSLNVGDLVPFYVQEILPGDEFKLDTSIIGRLQTPLAPAMDNLYLEYFYFFVPNRLVWNNWRYFMGESKSAWTDTNIYRIPTASLKTLGTVEDKSFLDYIGVPPGAYNNAQTEISALPRRCYDLIWNEWFRDQNLQDPLLTYEGQDVVSLIEQQRMALASNLLKANKMHDYFTSALPAPQKGPSVYIPFGDMELPVIADTIHDLGTQTTVKFKDINGIQPDIDESLNVVTDSNGALSGVGASVPSTDYQLAFSNLWAVNDNQLGAMTGAPTINALRFAFQVQKIYEKDARSGSRYVELIRSHFGVVSPDARQQRPEFLGGGRETIGMQQQVATTAGSDGDSEANMLGTVGAYSYTSHNKFNFKTAFTEHGFILGLATLRYKKTYNMGVPKYLTRKDRFDYYDPTLAYLGEQPIDMSEIYVDSSGSTIDGAVFGYQEAWADYRYNLNKATGDMRVGAGKLGNLWTYADNYPSRPTLSASWITEDKTNVERTLALSSDVVSNFYCDIYLNIYAIRPMPLYSIPGMIDHF